MQVVCGTCSPEKRYLTYMQKDGRVCNECVKGMNEEPLLLNFQLMFASLAAFAERKPEGDTTQQLVSIVRSSIECGVKPCNLKCNDGLVSVVMNEAESVLFMEVSLFQRDLRLQLQVMEMVFVSLYSRNAV